MNMKQSRSYAAIGILIASTLLVGSFVSAGTPSTLITNVENTFDSIIASIASSLGFASSTQSTITQGSYKYNHDHAGFTATYKDAAGNTLTIDYCDNGAYVAVKQTVCTSVANSCGMTGTGFVTEVDSHERQVGNSTSACSAETPSDSLCNNGLSGANNGGTNGGSGTNGGDGTNTGDNVNTVQNVDTNTSCSLPNNCGTDGNVRNACTGALVETCQYGCTNGVCNTACTPHNKCDTDGNIHEACSGALVQTCKYGCTDQACNTAPKATIATFTTLPSLVHKGDTTTVKWDTRYITDCSVAGTDGESWTGTSGTFTSNPIVSQTIFSISCQGEDGTTVSASSTVNIAPTYNEN